MIKIGLTNWFVQAVVEPRNLGEAEWRFSLTPQAICYRLAGKDVFTREFVISRLSSRMVAVSVQAQQARVMADELARETIRWCEMQGLVHGSLVEQGDQLRHAILEYIQRGECDTIEQVSLINISAIEDDMERIRRRPQTDPQWTPETNEAYVVRHQRRVEAEQNAFGLLLRWLTPAEKDEAANTNQITVTNKFGKFVVPVGRGKVRRFVDDEPEAEYCIVFEDANLPVGDEVLMKVGLLKTDPEKFMATAERWELTHV